jgi:hypothetical protein
MSFILLIIFVIFYLLSSLISYKETWVPMPYYYSSPPRRNMPYDLRCVPPPVPIRLNVPWNNSPYGYYYRPRCLL